MLRQWYLRVFRPGGVVKLPSGFFIKVRRLILYELDAVSFTDPGQFKYPYVVNGKTIERIYDISQWSEPPKLPTVPEELCAENSYEWGMWRIYNLYQAALAQRVKQVEAAEAYAVQVSRYILENCLSDADRRRVITPADYEAVYSAAINPEVSLSDLEAALAQTFKATFDGGPILEQVLEDKEGSAKVDALRLWASQAREAWGLKLAEWAAIPLKERAGMVVTLKLPDWLQSLEWAKKEREKKPG